MKSENINIKILFKRLTKSLLLIGLIAGSIFGLELSVFGDLSAYPKDVFVFTFFVSILFIVIYYLLFSILAFVAVLFKVDKEKILALVNIVGFSSILFTQFSIVWIEFNRPIKFGILTVLMFVIIALISVSIPILVRKALKNVRIIKFFNSYYMLLAYGIVFCLFVLMLSMFVRNTPVRENTLGFLSPKNKVLFFGLDAADWQIMEPLLESGKLPNIQSLIENGASGNLPTLTSCYNPFVGTITQGVKSAAIWNSIFTGKSPYKHGIKDFTYTEIPGIKNPYRYPLLPSFLPNRGLIKKTLGLNYRPFIRPMRKTKAAWNMLTEAGLETAALGWWMTWPAEKINGDLLTDRFDDEDLPSRWFPEDLVRTSEVDSVIANIKNPLQKDMDLFTSFSYDPDFKSKFKPQSREYLYNELLYNLFKSYYEDKFKSSLGLRLLKQHQYAFCSVYFYGFDTAGHAFMRFKYPELFTDVNKDAVKYFGNIIDTYLMWADNEIGKYLKIIDDNTIVVICSDHGMGPWQGVRLAKKDVRLSGSHRKNGIIIISGKPIRNTKISPASVLDVLPTIFYLLGMPVAKDFDGSIIENAIESSYLQKNPVNFIKTYETERYVERKSVSIDSTQKFDDAMIQRLRALGYIK